MIEIRSLVMTDWDFVKAIYLEGIATKFATFETSAPSWETWDSNHLPFARLAAVSEDVDQMAGWAALSRVSTRPVYRGVAEVSVYVALQFQGKGVGRLLLERLIAESSTMRYGRSRPASFRKTRPVWRSIKGVVFERSEYGKRSEKWTANGAILCYWSGVATKLAVPNLNIF